MPGALTDQGPSNELIDALPGALKTLGPGPYAVRSSGVEEDGEDLSHAGQFDTFLNVNSADVLTKVQQVWASGFSDRLATYSALNKTKGPQPPAIVVQSMIAAHISGVAFSADPVSGLRTRLVISAIAGLGDALVSGLADGQSWTLVQENIVSHPDGDPILSQDQLNEIADLCRRAEQHFGSPQDIEWAYDDQGLHILQSRPITTPLSSAAAA